MSFSFQCPHCKTIHEAADSLLGKTIRCSACSNLVMFDPEDFGDAQQQEAIAEESPAPTTASDRTNPYAAQSGSKPEKSAWKGETEVPPANAAGSGGDAGGGNGDDGGEFEQFSVPKNNDRVDEEMDMTPMVDVTFLLLIFFMVTASFTLQKSMDLPTKTQDEPSPNVVEDFEDNQEYVSVFVSPYNEYRVRTPEYDWEDAPNRHELRVRLADALQGKSKPEKLLIMAHADCTHEKVIQAMDIGIELLYKIQVIMTEEEF